MSTKKTYPRHVEHDLINLPPIRCSCGRVNNDASIAYYQQEARVRGNIVKTHVIEKLRALKQKNLQGLKKLDALQQIYDEGKTELQGLLRELFDSLDVNGGCCRRSYAIIGAGGDIDERFNDEDYYNFDQFIDEV